MVKRALLALSAALLLASPSPAQTITGGGGGASIAAGSYWYYSAYPNASVTNTAAETILTDVPIPANVMGPVGILRITTQWSATNSANNKALRCRYSNTANSLSGVSIHGATSNSWTVAQTQSILRNAGSTGSQTTFNNGFNAYAGGASTPVAVSVDTTQVSHLTCTVQLSTSTETATLLAITVEALHP